MVQGISQKFVALAVALVAFTAPALADVSCTGEQLTGEVSATAVTSALSSALGSGTTINGATEEQLISAYASVVKADPTMASELAGIIALGRPDAIEGLTQSVAEVCPLAVEALKQKIDTTAMNPTADQLAALANAEGTAPAAGDAGEGSPE